MFFLRICRKIVTFPTKVWKMETSAFGKFCFNNKDFIGKPTNKSRIIFVWKMKKTFTAKYQQVYGIIRVNKMTLFDSSLLIGHFFFVHQFCQGESISRQKQLISCKTPSTVLVKMRGVYWGIGENSLAIPIHIVVTQKRAFASRRLARYLQRGCWRLNLIKASKNE